MPVASLKPTTIETAWLPSGHLAEIAKAVTTFPAWRGAGPADRYGQKPILKFAGRMAFAELAILWSLQREGWNGVWIDSYHRKYRRGYWNSAPVASLPDGPRKLLEKVAKTRSGMRGGTWDVFCWRGAKYLFAESKQKGHDRIRPAKLQWLEAALSIGVPIDSFLIVEWTIRGDSGSDVARD